MSFQSWPKKSHSILELVFTFFFIESIVDVHFFGYTCEIQIFFFLFESHIIWVRSFTFSKGISLQKRLKLGSHGNRISWRWMLSNKLKGDFNLNTFAVVEKPKLPAKAKPSAKTDDSALPKAEKMNVIKANTAPAAPVDYPKKGRRAEHSNQVNLFHLWYVKDTLNP